jgi:hypothetical protein
MFHSPARLSVSTDGVIYLISDKYTSVYQSTDDGVTWSHVFNVTDGWRVLASDQSVNIQ